MLIFVTMQQNKLIRIIILGLLSAIGPFSIDMYLPGFPGIAKDLHTTVEHVALSLSSFFIGISFGQLLYGPMLDRFGRKKPLLIGLVVYIFTSIGCAFAATADALIVLRLLQALGACVGMVASRAMVRDLFPVEENAKIFSTLMLIVGVSPMLAPTIGGYLTAGIGWQYVFVVLTGLGILLLTSVYFFLPESKQPDKNFSLQPVVITKNFLAVLKIPQFYVYTLVGAVASAGLYAYISGSPYIFMEIYKVSERHYGWIFAIIAGGLITSAQINTLLLKTYKSEQIIPIALTVQAFTGIMLVVGSAYGWVNLYTTVLGMFIFLSCQGFTFPNASALSMAPFSKNAGSASALLGFIQMAIGAGASALVSILANKTAVPMTGIMASCSFTALCFLLIGQKVIGYKARLGNVQDESIELISTL